MMFDTDLHIRQNTIITTCICIRIQNVCTYNLYAWIERVDLYILIYHIMHTHTHTHAHMQEECGCGIVFGTDPSGSLVCRSFVPGGPAESSGLVQQGDVLASVDGCDVLRKPVSQVLFLSIITILDVTYLADLRHMYVCMYTHSE